MPSLLGSTKAILAVLPPFAAFCMWGLIERNGYFPALRRIRTEGPFVLPGSTTPIQKVYTGVLPIDFHLRVLQAFFANVVDGSSPRLSLFSFHFSGTLVAVIGVMLIESMREGHAKHVISRFLLWGWATQSFGYGIVLPAWCAFYLFTSPAATGSWRERVDAATLSRVHDVQLIPWSMTIGFGLPTLLMCLPHLSANTHQGFVAAWQVFPLWIAAAQTVLQIIQKDTTVEAQRATRTWSEDSMSARTATTAPGRSSSLDGSKRNLGLPWISGVYGFLFTVASITHVTTITTILFRSFEHLSFGDVFLPMPFWSATQVNMVQGVLYFLQYDDYIGTLGAIIWVAVLYRQLVPQPIGSLPTAWSLARWLAILIGGGPGALFTALCWQRENLIQATRDSKVAAK